MRSIATANGDQQHDSDHRKAVGVAQDRGLSADRLADGDDGAVHRAGWIGVAVRHEVALEVGEPFARRRFDGETFGVIIAEWNCSRLVKKVSTAAVPIAPPRLRIMLKRPEAAPASLCAIPTNAIAEIGVMTIA